MKKADIKPGKVYVGKLPDSGLGEEDIKEHFSQYGAIAEVIRPIDKSKNNEPKNFCFVTFERERVAKKLIEEGSCIIGGHKMQIKQVINSRCFENILRKLLHYSVQLKFPGYTQPQGSLAERRYGWRSRRLRRQPLDEPGRSVGRPGRLGRE